MVYGLATRGMFIVVDSADSEISNFVQLLNFVYSSPPRTAYNSN